MKYKNVSEYNPVFNLTDKEGNELEGKYQGSRTFKNNQGNDQVMHTVILEDGTEMDFYGAGQLDYLIRENVTEGKQIKVRYFGKKKMKDSTQMAHNFAVYVAEE